MAGSRLPLTLLIVSLAMRTWLSFGLVTSRICLHPPTLIPPHMLAQALADLEVPAEDLASLSFSAATVSTA